VKLPLLSSPRSPSEQRLVRAGVCAAVICAAWYATVRPMEQGLMKRGALLSKAMGELEASVHTTAAEPPLDDAMAQLIAQATALNQWTAKSGDAGRLYEAFRALAAEHSIRIERIEPSGSRTIQRAAAAPGLPAPSPGEVFGYTLEVVGAYEDIALFLYSCEARLGASKIISFRIAPAFTPGTTPLGTSPEGPSQLSATIETSHLRVTTSKLMQDASQHPAGTAP